MNREPQNPQNNQKPSSDLTEDPPPLQKPQQVTLNLKFGVKVVNIDLSKN